MTEPEPPADILVVDDTPANLKLLTDLLKSSGHRVRPVPSGKLAIKAAEASPPDLFLLDINMPDMNGFEVCRTLKANPELCDIPVIFITAFTETSDKVKAFNAGGVDYITKPFQAQEVEARVESHLKLRRQQKQLESQYGQLRHLEELRDNLTHMIIHDMRSPLGAIQLGLQLLGGDLQGNERATDDLRMITLAANELTEMVKSLLDVTRLESGNMSLDLATHDLRATALAAIESNRILAEEARVQLAVTDAAVQARFDRHLIHRVFSNLLGNAIKFSPAKSIVEVRFQPHLRFCRVEVVDSGPGIPEDSREKIFEKFGQVKMLQREPRHSTGLGLTFCRRAVEAHGGQIGVEGEPGEGAVFWFELPRGN